MTAPTATADRPGGPPPDGPPPGLPPPPAPRGRTGAMRVFAVLAVVFALSTVAWGCWSLVDVMALRTYHTTTSFPIVDHLELHVRDADVTLVPDATDRIVVDRTVRRGLRTATYSAHEQDGTLVLRDGCHFGMGIGCSTSLTVHVPIAMSVSGSMGDGSFSARGLVGGVQLTTADGDVHLQAMNGSVTLHSGDGELVIGDQRAPAVSISSGDGDIHLILANSPSSVHLSTGDGDVNLCLPHGTGPYAVTTQHGSGNLEDEVPSDPRAADTLTVSAGDGDLALLLC